REAPVGEPGFEPPLRLVGVVMNGDLLRHEAIVQTLRWTLPTRGNEYGVPSTWRSYEEALDGRTGPARRVRLQQVQLAGSVHGADGDDGERASNAGDGEHDREAGDERQGDDPHRL